MPYALKKHVLSFLAEDWHTIAEISAKFDLNGRNVINTLRHRNVEVRSRWATKNGNKRKEYIIAGEIADSHVSPKSKERR